VKKAACIVLLLLLGVLSINIARRLAPAREPVHDGKRLRAWLEDLNSTSLYTQETAQAAIRELGTNAVPALVQMLQSSDSLFKLRLMKLLGKQSLVRYRFRVAEEDHLLAIKGCRALGPLARPAIPVLIGLLNYCAPANEAACSLIVIDKGIFPLTRAVTNENLEVAVRSAAVAQLASGRYDETTAVAALLASLQDRDPEISSQAARALGVLKKRPDLVPNALTQSLNSPSALVRRESAVALGRFGTKAQIALPFLLKATEDDDNIVREKAVLALQSISPAAAANSP
jgi:HEAT repeat protein